MSQHREAQLSLRGIKKGQFSFSLHAGERSLTRSLSKEQVIQVAENLVYWKWQGDHESYLFVGTLAEGQGAGFTAVLENGVVVVTVFRRKLKAWERKQKTE